MARVKDGNFEYWLRRASVATREQSQVKYRQLAVGRWQLAVGSRGGKCKAKGKVQKAKVQDRTA